MGPCIVSIFQYTCISNKMQHYTVYLYLETALHVSGGTSTHHQERIQLYLHHLVFVTPLLLSAAIVEELEPVRVCCGWRTPPTAHCVCGRAGRHDYHHDTKVKPEAATAVIEFLMISGKTPQTSWAVNKHQDNKLKNFCTR
jgi:hypothetical protein